MARGDAIRVRILTIEVERQRIALTALDDGPDPLLSHPVGTVVTGELAKIVHFGVMVRLPSGIEALLHRSEIAEGTRLEVGLPIRVRIHIIDEELGRIALVTDPRLPQGVPPIATMPQPTKASKDTGQEAVPNQDPVDPGEVTEFILEKLREPGVLLTAVLAQEVIHAFGSRLHRDGGTWLGMGNFTTMLRTLVPGVRLEKHQVLPPPE